MTATTARLESKVNLPSIFLSAKMLDKVTNYLMLFNMYSEWIMRNALENRDGKITINGTIINNLWYADDTTVIATSNEELEEFIRVVLNKNKNQSNDSRPIEPK